MPLSLAIVILNFNGEKFLRQFLAQVVSYSLPHRVIVADNASTDQSELVVKSVVGAEWLPLPQNNGYAGGYNLALKKVEADIFILLNSDVEVTANWLEPIINLFNNNERIAACQPKVLSFYDKTKFEYAGAAGGYLDFMGVPFCRGRLFDTLETDKNQYDYPAEVFWATGACLAIRSKIFWEVGGFDERFFAHMEEIDLCWRIQKLGYSIWCQPKSVVYHVGGGTLSAESPRKLFLNYRNGWWMMMKNMSPQQYQRMKYRRLLADSLAMLNWLIKGRPLFARAILTALTEAFRNSKNYNQNNNTPVANSNNLYPRSVIWEYFIKQRKTFDQLP
jgi:GT2 family glycosyltransferase